MGSTALLHTLSNLLSSLKGSFVLCLQKWYSLFSRSFNLGILVEPADLINEHNEIEGLGGREFASPMCERDGNVYAVIAQMKDEVINLKNDNTQLRRNWRTNQGSVGVT
ncbi:hypothetical protein FA15DRAFT_661412 [Coprinopsis marcescibilis]|uniref:Uncharacterized protein n=1 Tax=Coprinopsis marcescibilis TaxID=230819 RepID=A0A5C3KCK2_COPMA|nr:hypothetical protein FA15DRAFT_661412 [Coprinopsis marcescibilis]